MRQAQLRQPRRNTRRLLPARVRTASPASTVVSAGTTTTESHSPTSWSTGDTRAPSFAAPGLYRHQRYALLSHRERLDDCPHRPARARLATPPPTSMTVRVSVVRTVTGSSHVARCSPARSRPACSRLPLRLVSPAAAQADGYCAAQCLDDAATAYNARYTKCFVSAFGIDIPDKQALGDVRGRQDQVWRPGGMVVANEIAGLTRARSSTRSATTSTPAAAATRTAAMPKSIRHGRGDDLPGILLFCPTGVVAAGCLPAGAASSCDRSCAACQESKANGFPVHGICCTHRPASTRTPLCPVKRPVPRACYQRSG